MTENNVKKNKFISLLFLLVFFFKNSFRARVSCSPWRRPSHDINSGTSVSKYRVVVSAKRPAPWFITRATVTLSRRTTFIFSRTLVINREKKNSVTFMPFYYPHEKYVISPLPLSTSFSQKSGRCQGGNSRENFVGTPGIRKGRRTKAQRRIQASRRRSGRRFFKRSIRSLVSAAILRISGSQ